VENLAPTGIRSPDRPALSQYLYRLSYRAHKCILFVSDLRNDRIRFNNNNNNNNNNKRQRSPYNRPQRAQRGSRGIAVLILDLGATRGWVVSTTHRPLYPRERPGNHCKGGWVGPRTSLDVCEEPRSHRSSIARPSNQLPGSIPTELPGP
jgi:hypothetical protein